MPRPPRRFVAEPFGYHQELELRIESLSNLGIGVGRVPINRRPAADDGPGLRSFGGAAGSPPDSPVAEHSPSETARSSEGWVVFVPFCLPGELVRARVYRNDRNCSSADLLEILEPSADRVDPRCPLFGTCGGCQYQHLAYQRQLDWKTRQVGELLHHMAGIEFPVNPCIPSPRQWNYRSKITPHFDRPKDGKAGPIGFLAHSRRSLVIDVPQCPIAMEPINRALPGIRASARAGSYKRGATLLLRATEDRVETNPGTPVTEHLGDLRFHFLAGDFFQNNPFILPAFTGYAAERAAAGGMRFLVDAYCGSGLFAISLAASFEQVAGVEISETSADWARRNAQTNSIANARFHTASAEAIFAEVDFPAAGTCVLIDPPRKGSSPEFLDQLCAFSPTRVVYVSCNPASQIRDLVRLRGAGYTLTDVQPFDLFPQTRHLECIMTLER